MLSTNLHPRLSAFGRLAFSLPSKDPTLEECKRKDRRVHKWGGCSPHGTQGAKRSAAWWILVERRGSASFQSDTPKAATKSSESLEGSIGWVQDSLGISKGLYLIRGFAQQEIIDVPSSCDIQIDLDVPRTTNGHVMFMTRYGMG